jgi:hypothetical protein
VQVRSALYYSACGQLVHPHLLHECGHVRDVHAQLQPAVRQPLRAQCIVHVRTACAQPLGFGDQHSSKSALCCSAAEEVGMICGLWLCVPIHDGALDATPCKYHEPTSACQHTLVKNMQICRVKFVGDPFCMFYANLAGQWRR